MKRQLLATVSGLALTGAASAADLPARVPVKAPSPPAVATQLWAGPYIGINGGAVWHRLDLDTSLGLSPFESLEFRKSGGTFGGQIGYNWQSQSFVFGVEVDANWINSRQTVQQAAFSGLGFLTEYTTRLSWLATARVRGGVAYGRTLLFATGGVAAGGVENSWHFLPPVFCPGGVTCTVSEDQTRVGWAAGGGIEHFVSNPHVTVKAEALYVDLGRRTVAGTGDYTSRFRNTAIVGRLGLNLKW